MRYFSPTSLPGNPSLDPPDKKALMLERRKLLTELQLSADGIIHIKDRPFSKNDLLEYFYPLQDDTILSYYAAVSKDQTLVDFLEASQLPEDAAFAKSPLYAEAPFLEWISPFFYTAFVEYITICLSEGEDDQLEILLRLRPLLTDYHRENAWIHLGQILEKDVAQLEHFHQQADQGRPVSTEEIAPLASDAHIRMIVMLPEAPFAGIRDRYAFHLMQLSIHVFNIQKDKRNLAKQWMKKVKQLAASEKVAAEADEKIHEMRKIRRWSDTFLIRVAVGVCIILIKLFASGNHSDDSVPKINKFDYITGKDTVAIYSVKQWDSLVHSKKNDSVSHSR
jgi:hypothetical protein